ncbi:hypothetical protein KEM52_000267 [Ascosphaera acerosa]|nr:hypothetical protein KEM52_000267 [Ascosphaera acerosa]
MTTKRSDECLSIFCGTFIDLPRVPHQLPTATTPPIHKLRIRHGALAVQHGRIIGETWDVESDDDLRRFIEDVRPPRHDGIPELSGRRMNGNGNGLSGVSIIRSSAERCGFFFPGFIDTHVHAPQYQNSGIFGSSTLLDWLETYTFPLESSFREKRAGDYRTKYDQVSPELAYNRVVQKTLANGTTCASYFGTIHVPATHLLARICHQRGQRALIGRVCMDRAETCADYYRDETTEMALVATRKSVNAILGDPALGDLIQPIVTPRFAPSCTSEALRGLADIAASYNPPLRIQTHISENVNEVAWVKQLYPECKSYTDVYDQHGLLTPRMILAHAIHLTPEERALIRDRGSGVAHCPTSNSAIGSGVCPVRTLLDDGIAVGLGTDVSGGWQPSILEVVRQACLVSRTIHFNSDYIADLRECGKDDIAHGRQKISVAEALWLATRGGARVVDMDGDDGIGGFDVGQQFDAQLIELGKPLIKRDKDESCSSNHNVDIFGWETWEEMVDKWVWNGDDRNVQAVWVAGRKVKR